MKLKLKNKILIFFSNQNHPNSRNRSLQMLFWRSYLRGKWWTIEKKREEMPLILISYINFIHLIFVQIHILLWYKSLQCYRNRRSNIDMIFDVGMVIAPVHFWIWSMTFLKYSQAFTKMGLANIMLVKRSQKLIVTIRKFRLPVNSVLHSFHQNHSDFPKKYWNLI